MADAEPLVALLEIMLRTLSNVPKVKPGGHPEDIFIDLPEEEKENLECSICYCVLKEARQCANRHKFCYSCIFVWSTSGHPINHGRCPVCRTDGNYVPVPEMDERINAQLVKCSLKSCKWVGPLGLLSAHQHSTYSSTGSDADKRRQLPELKSVANTHAQSSRSSGRSLGATTALSQSTSDSPSGVSTPRQPLSETLNRNSEASTSRVVTRRQSSNPGGATQRSRTRSRHRQPSTSPTRRPGVTSTGLPNRMTSRQRIDNGRTVANPSMRQSQTNPTQNENVAPSEQATTTPLTPRPPANPRPQGQAARRLPTLPNIVNPNPRSTARAALSDTNGNAPGVANSIDSNNNIAGSRDIPTTPETPRFTSEQRRTTGLGGFGNVRNRLTESRNRLDFLMNAFSVELDRGRQDLSVFQQEREQRRQEQLAEVRDLGRRLGQVAQELRGLLTQRRQIHSQIDHLVESATDSD